MTLSEFLDIMQLSFLEEHMVRDKASNDKKYKDALDALTAYAEEAAKNLTDRAVAEYGRTIKRFADALEEFRHVAIERGGKNNTTIPNDEYEDHLNQIEIASQNLPLNRVVALRREDSEDYFEDEEDFINTNGPAIRGDVTEEDMDNNIAQNGARLLNVSADSDRSVSLDDSSEENEPANEEEYGDARFKTKGKFEDILQKLKKASTLYNSSEYRSLIKMVDFANKYDEWEGTENLTYEQTTITKLIAIKSKINQYINHKAIKGVNQNAYYKLAAVEELNKFVTDAIDKVNFTSFNYGGKEVKREDYNFTYEEEVNDSKFRRIRGDAYNAPVMTDEIAVRDQKIEIGARYPDAKVKDMLNVDNCMSRIILSALSHRVVTHEDIVKLEDMQDQMYNNPTDKIKPVRPSAEEEERTSDARSL